MVLSQDVLVYGSTSTYMVAWLLKGNRCLMTVDLWYFKITDEETELQGSSQADWI